VIEGLLIWPPNLGGPDRRIMRKLPLPRVPDIEGTRHTLSCGQYRLTAEISEFLDRVSVPPANRGTETKPHEVSEARW